MKYQQSSFRWGREHFAENDPLWLEIHESIALITRATVIAEKRRNFQEWREGGIKAPAVGGQKILNLCYPHCSLVPLSSGELIEESRIYVLCPFS